MPFESEDNNQKPPSTTTTTTKVQQSMGHQPPPQTDPLHCPRCDSTNTKFCYYNNYNLAQPRHFCKSCRRYWTQGGTLRDVPVGGALARTPSALAPPLAPPLPARLPLPRSPKRSPQSLPRNPFPCPLK
ncbi:hypothetical protein Pyn_39193 [Prunus yedoensis var. nudiflora]|uniref:Dof zinc finger protein n=1 Tax=Prunus yedoensis var. nudiflora TaxID=2094558 RepID=A0A314YZX0_PRUYE|nr:hypothetical protein Pyn_39193 [Prunus yedoensis var. nudiflora]